MKSMFVSLSCVCQRKIRHYVRDDSLFVISSRARNPHSIEK